MRVPKGEETEQKSENLLKKVITENILNLVKEMDIQVKETQRVPNKMNAKRPTQRHIIIKITKVKDKERILKAARENPLVTYRVFP